jgi:hypothetical protein
MTQRRWWLAAALLTLALTCTTRAQEVPCSEPVPAPHPCGSEPKEPVCTGSRAGTCPKASSCPASAKHNEGSGCCQAKGGCCAAGCCAAEHARHKKACHGEECAPSAAMILPTWFGPMPIPMPAPVASFFFGGGVDYHVRVVEPMPPPAVAVPPAPPICSVPAIAPACPYAYPPPPPPAPPMMRAFPNPPNPHMLRYAVIQGQATGAQSWKIHVCSECDKAEMEIQGVATKICCDSMDVTIGDKHALKVSTHHNQIAVEGDNVKASADKVSKGCDGDCIVLDGHVHIQYEQDDQKVEASVEHVKISLKDGHMDIKMGGGHETVPAICH